MTVFDDAAFEEVRKLYSGKGTPWWSRFLVSGADRLLFLVILLLRDIEQRLERIEHERAS